MGNNCGIWGIVLAISAASNHCRESFETYRHHKIMTNATEYSRQSSLCDVRNHAATSDERSWIALQFKNFCWGVQAQRVAELPCASCSIWFFLLNPCFLFSCFASSQIHPSAVCFWNHNSWFTSATSIIHSPAIPHDAMTYMLCGSKSIMRLPANWFEQKKTDRVLFIHFYELIENKYWRAR